MKSGMRLFDVKPVLPERLKSLNDISYNLWWCWNPEAVELFRRIDRILWDKTEHNPVKLLSAIPQERLNELLHSESFLDHMDRVYEQMKDYIESNGWFASKYPESAKKKNQFAYFSAEFGIHESLPIYSGGLGILAGDHLKSASDLGLPLIGMGLLYSQGYFKQYLNDEGWQQEFYPENDFQTMAVKPVLDDAGNQMEIDVDIKGQTLFARIWKVAVGRITLYLLDTNISKNSGDLRNITSQLYGGDLHTRIRQEILLGIGGIRALRKMGLNPAVYHMNEGHSSFLTLENIKNYMTDAGVSFNQAREAVIAESVFTTHTPVPAGNDRFSASMIEEYMAGYAKNLGISMHEFLSYGRENVDDATESFCMTVLALKLSAHANGVSRLHGYVSRDMWKNVWKRVPVDEIPIDHITNGIHIPTWLSDDMTVILDRYLGKRWRDESYDMGVWERVNQIPGSELWRTHERLRERLVAFARRKVKAQLEKKGAPKSEIEAAESVLSSDTLTIGFARRFATYKRGTLIFRDIERLKKIILNKERPVQFVFAGKAHPKDNEGKEFIKRIVQITRDPELKSSIVFLEDYGMDIARYMVQGVDIWLNNPRRPLEASGTSGMKVVPNGGLNLSIPDGWWCEAYNTENGWSIGSGEMYDDTNIQDELESRLFYELMEKEIVPAFYNRGGDGLPTDWIAMMKNSMRTISREFNTNRMVADYTNKFYVVAKEKALIVANTGLEKAKEINNNKQLYHKNWGSVVIKNIKIDKPKNTPNLYVGDKLSIEVEVTSSEELTKGFLKAEAYFGIVDNYENISEPEIVVLEEKETSKGVHLYTGSVTLNKSGKYGVLIRVTPAEGKIVEKFVPGLITWSN